MHKMYQIKHQQIPIQHGHMNANVKQDLLYHGLNANREQEPSVTSTVMCQFRGIIAGFSILYYLLFLFIVLILVGGFNYYNYSVELRVSLIVIGSLGICVPIALCTILAQGK